VRDAIVLTLTLPADWPAAMMNTQALARMAEAHSIGGHGFAHRSLTAVDDVETELQKSQQALPPHAGGKIESMSFPHGAYSERVIAAALSIGYRYLFSSDAVLNRLSRRFNHARPLGRIHISERAIVDAAGRFCPEQLATWLFLRPCGNETVTEARIHRCDPFRA
jgi:peptidoglycan/xylan/chitin deacetylase (PgdA/CDA1 family)